MLMPDREKAIKGLECCGQPMMCDECPYDSDMGGCFTNLKADALELLKEQEPVKPNKIPHSITYPCGAYVCGNCEIRILEPDDNFCPNCGMKVKWDD